MDPRDSHFNRTRYDPSFPPIPTHHFSDHAPPPPPPPADYYPHPQFHPPAYPPPPPPPRHHRGGDHHPAGDPRLYYPHPHHNHNNNHNNHLHHLDTPHYDHHNHHPPPPRVSARGGPHIDPWDGGPNPRNARSAFDGNRSLPPRPEPTQLDWECHDLERSRYRMREDEILVEDFRDRVLLRPPPPPPPHVSGLRMREDVILVENFRDRLPQQPRVSRLREDEILEEDFDPQDTSARRISVPTSHQDVEDSKISAVEIVFQETHYANKGNDEGFSNSEIGYQWNRCAGIDGYEDGFKENHYKAKRKWVHEDDGFQENCYKGKRWNSSGGSSQYNNEWSSSKRHVQKTSALGRIQSGISVWNRIEEKPPSPSLPADDFSHLGFLEENQPEIDTLDLSYKSNALVAKVVVHSSPDQQLSNEGQNPRVLIPKDRMKKKGGNMDREQVVIPIVSSSVVSKEPVSSSFQVSNVLDGTTHIVKGSSSKLASDGSKKESGTLSKSVGVGTKPAGDGSKKAIRSNKLSLSKSVSDGPKKGIGPSAKHAGSSSSRPPPKKVTKVASAKKVTSQKAVKLVEKNIHEDIRQDDTIIESKPTNYTGSQPFETASIDNIALEQSGKDANFVYWPMEVAPPIDNSTTEQSTNVGLSVYEQMVVMTPTKDINSDQGTMAVSSANSAAEQATKDVNFFHDITVGTTSSEKNHVEHSGKNFDAVQEPMVAAASAENSAAERSGKNVKLVQDNVINDLVKEETIALFEEVAHDFISPFASNSRIVIDVSSDSSPEEVTVAKSPSKVICSVNNVNDENCRKEWDIVNSSEEICMSFNESSSFGLVGDAQLVQQVTVSVGAVISPRFCGFLKDGHENRNEKQIDEQHTLGTPSIRDKFEILGEPMIENCDFPVPSDTSNFVQDLNPPNSVTDKDGNDLLLPSRGLPMSESVPVLEDYSVNAATSARMEQLLPFSSSQKGTLMDVSRACESSFMMENQSDCQQLFDSQCLDNNDNTNEQEEKTTKNGCSLASESVALEHEMETKADNTMQYHPPVETQLLRSYEPKEQLNADAKPTKAVSTSTKFILGSGVPRGFSNQLSSLGSVKETACSNRNARNKTWHRTDTPSSASHIHGNLQSTSGIYKQLARKQLPKKIGRVSSPSYVRKGNSLIRKPANAIPPPIIPHGFAASSKNSYLTERSMNLGIVDNSLNVKTCSNPSLERPKTPPLYFGSKFPSCTVDTPKDFPQTISEDPVSETGIVAQAKAVEGQVIGALSGSVDDQSIAAALTRKRMIYVKHKSNQLVAAPPSGLGDSSNHPAEKAEKLPASSDLYYMRKKNQLILNALLSSDSHPKQDRMTPSNSDDQGASNVLSLKDSRTCLFKKRLDKVLRKTHKHSKFSHVWTLGGGQSSEKGVTLHSSWKVMPYLFPWKRTTYNKFCTNKVAMNCNKGSLSSISRKLQLMRKRDTIYTVSNDGFSLRKAGVVSIGGSSLKWSKSIDRHSKKANEEATLAVAEAERKKRERKRKRSVSSRAKDRHSFRRKSRLGIELQQGERIYRVGSVRYKMDASKRTLIRVSDEQPADGVGQQTEKNTFVPRRLLIGNDEYIRTGSGNKLVRDPKKLIRMLASEKIRWSLHTARLRLAKKQRYCQFFTRFGKCNKNSGKCPYIHDPGKVAICTKFLRGVCTDVNCKLTHKIIPERMPDCSYFLQGLCTNVSCPYRHVYVNPKASVCDGFLRGYCADGDECRKKHSYVCPEIEATGKCPQGSKCKLHHPKSRNKANNNKKKKRCEHQSNNRGRYFRSKIVSVSESLPVASDKSVTEKDADPFCCDGQFADFISIDGYSDDDGMETDCPSNPKESDSDLSDLQPDELDALIKPVRIMNDTGLPNPSLTS